MKCPECGRPMEDVEEAIAHLIEAHSSKVQQYIDEQSPVVPCPAGCGTLYFAEDLTPHTVCTGGPQNADCRHEVGYDRFAWAAIAMLDAAI